MRMYLKTTKDILYRRTKNSQKVRVHFVLQNGTFLFVFWHIDYQPKLFILVFKIDSRTSWAELLHTAWHCSLALRKGAFRAGNGEVMGQEWGLLGRGWPIAVLPASSSGFPPLLTHSEALRFRKMRTHLDSRAKEEPTALNKNAD